MCFVEDIRDLISVDDVMQDEELHMGPNGGLIYCMEWVLLTVCLSLIVYLVLPGFLLAPMLLSSFVAVMWFFIVFLSVSLSEQLSENFCGTSSRWYEEQLVTASPTKYCSLSVCVSVCLSTCISQKPHVQISQNFVCKCCVWPWLGSVMTMRYVTCTLILWMTSGLHIIEWIFQRIMRWLTLAGFGRCLCNCTLLMWEQAVSHDSLQL